MTDKIDDGGPAFPSEGEGHGNPKYHSPGMSLRDYFAGQFLVGAATDNGALDVSIDADQYDIDEALREHWGNIARTAYIAADAMLAARKASS